VCCRYSLGTDPRGVKVIFFVVVVLLVSCMYFPCMIVLSSYLLGIDTMVSNPYIRFRIVYEM
jgi:hypothetical protein